MILFSIFILLFVTVLSSFLLNVADNLISIKIDNLINIIYLNFNYSMGCCGNQMNKNRIRSYVLVIILIFIPLFLLTTCVKENPTEHVTPTIIILSNPTPSVDETIYQDSISLSWECEGDYTFDVYIGFNITYLIKVDSNLIQTQYDAVNLEYNNRYYWKIIAKSKVNDSSISETWSFYTRSPVSIIQNPDPSNNSYHIEITKLISWDKLTNPPKSLLYDVYFDTTPDPVLVSQGQSNTFYNPGRLGYNNTYFWKVIGKEINGDSTISETWSFRTQPEILQFNNNRPRNYQGFVTPDANLSWEMVTNLGEVVNFDIYLDTLPDPMIAKANHTGFTFDTGLKQKNTIYYWKVVGFNPQGDTVTGPVWQFKTEPSIPVFALFEIYHGIISSRKYEYVKARFDSSYAPDTAINILNPNKVEIADLFNLSLQSPNGWYYYDHHRFMIKDGDIVEFIVEGNYDVNHLDFAVEYEECLPVITHPKLLDTVYTNGFNVYWENTCTDSVLLIITSFLEDISYEATIENTGHFYVTPEIISNFNNFRNDIFEMKIITFKEMPINAFGYSHNSFVRFISRDINNGFFIREP